jgi:hypothetical protein
MTPNLAWRALEKGELDHGRQLAETCLQSEPERMACRAALVVAAARQGALDDARKGLEALTDPGADASAAQAELALADKDLARACEYLHDACGLSHAYACRREKEVCPAR